MAKTKAIIKFKVVPYNLGQHKGNRVQIVASGGLFDLDFCREVVNEKRLTTSPDDLLHNMRMLAEVACQKVNEDGRPRGITRLIKWQPIGSGTVESVTSPWDQKTCRGLVKPILLADAAKIIDASFQNVSTGIGVKLNDVTWIGAKTVQNVLKIGMDFASNGSHMEFLEGDSATLTVGETTVALENKGSDVSRGIFAFPPELSGVEPGTQALFVMKSRGGIPDGQVYTVKKTVTILEGDTPPVPAPIVEFVNGNPPGSVVTSENVTLGGAYLTGATVTLKYADGEDVPVAKVLEPMSATDEEIVLADNWYEGLPSSKPNIVFEVKTAGGKATIAADFEA